MPLFSQERSSTDVQQIAETNVRPLRLGFVVNRDTDYEIVQKVFQYNTSLWGGYYNIFVPSDGTSIREDWWLWLLHHDPDVIFLVGTFENALVNRISVEIAPLQIFEWDNSLLKALIGEADKVAPIVMGSVLRTLYEQHRGTLPTDLLRVYPVIKEGLYQRQLEIQFGSYTEDSEYSRVFREWLGATELTCEPASVAQYLELVSALGEKETPIDLTTYTLSATLPFTAFGEPVLILSNGEIDDLFLYQVLRWSKRTLSGALTVFIIPFEYLKTDDELEILLNWLFPKLATTVLTLASLSLTIDHLIEIRRRIKAIITGKGELRVKIRKCNFQPVIPAVMSEKKDQVVNIREQKVEFEVNSPSFVQRIPSYRRWIFELNLSPGFGNRRGFIPSMFPDLNYLLSDYGHYAIYAGWGSRVRIARGLLAVPISKKTTLASIYLPTNTQLICRACENGGYRVNKNRSTYYEAILDLVGSIKGIQFLKHKKVLELLLLRDMLQGDAFTLEQISDRVKPKGKQEIIEFKNWIQTLANTRVLLRGYKLKCSRCELNTWYDLPDIGEYVTCHGCRFPFPIPLDARFAFKLNMLFADGNNQGTITSLLTLLLIYNASAHSFIWQADVDLNKGKDDSINVDLIAMCDGALIIAECKNRFETEKVEEVDKLIDQLVRNIAVAKSLNAKVFLFSTLQESIPQRVIDFLEDQDEQETKLRIRLVTTNELIESKFAATKEQNTSPSLWADLIKPLPQYVGVDCESDDEDYYRTVERWSM
jgi:hypothetical protein